MAAFTVRNQNGASLTVLDYGATIQSLCVPDREGNLVDVVLGYDTEEEYKQNGGYLGGAIGRVGNRIGGSAFSLNGKQYRLARNDGENHLHGGANGFDKRYWTVHTESSSIVCSRLSPDGEEGYPGNLCVQIRYTLTEDNRLVIEYDADTDADTPVNLTNHSYFNLNGGGTALHHRLQLFAERITANGPGCLPTGELRRVEGTPFDFRQEKEIGAEIDADDEQLKLVNGYDINYVLSGEKAAVVTGDQSGIVMTVRTDMPGMQFYTANWLSERPGKNGGTLSPRDAVCFETQLFPNAMNCYGFPSPILRAGQHLHSETSYEFTIV